MSKSLKQYVTTAVLTSVLAVFPRAANPSDQKTESTTDNTPTTTVLINTFNDTQDTLAHNTIRQILTSQDSLDDGSQAVWTLQRMVNKLAESKLPVTQDIPHRDIAVDGILGNETAPFLLNALLDVPRPEETFKISSQRLKLILSKITDTEQRQAYEDKFTEQYAKLEKKVANLALSQADPKNAIMDRRTGLILLPNGLALLTNNYLERPLPNEKHTVKNNDIANSIKATIRDNIIGSPLLEEHGKYRTPDMDAKWENLISTLVERITNVGIPAMQYNKTVTNKLKESQRERRQGNNSLPYTGGKLTI